METVKRHPVFRLLKEAFPEKLDLVERESLTLALPDIRSIRENIDLDATFFDHHILRIQDEGWYRGLSQNHPTIIERQEPFLKLLSGPDYQPSFQRGLYSARILEVVHGVDPRAFSQYKMFMMDRPLLPKYTKASLGSISSGTSGISSADSSTLTNTSLRSQATVTTVCSAPPKSNGKTSSRASSAASMGRPYQTNKDEAWSSKDRIGNRKPKSAPEKQPLTKSQNRKKKPANGRQWSADSGVDTSGIIQDIDFDEKNIDAPFILPPRITTYAESECYLLNLPRCDQFATHLARNLRPLIAELRFTTPQQAKDVITKFATKLHRLAQESVIAFPRSASTVNNSPRFQEFLRIAVENVVVGAVHDLVFPVICHLSRKEDRELRRCTEYLLHKTKFSPDQLGLSEDFCIPLPAAVVELASLDQRTTPLYRMTCIYDTVQQVGVHIRQAVLDTHADSDDVNIPDDLPYPDDRDMVLLLATVVVHARPLHLLSTLNYADLFAWAVPSDMIEAVTLMSSAVDFVRNVQPQELKPVSGKLKREVSMEEIIQLTDELSQSYDRRGNRREPFKSALDLHRERFAQRLERSTADRTRRQEEAWARLDRCPTPIQEHPIRQRRGLLRTIHNRLLCSNDPDEVIEA